MPKFPRLLKWIVSVVVIFFLLLTLFRFIFYLHYKPEAYSFPGAAFLMGLRLDLRIVCIIGLVMLLLCAFPFINPFKNVRARKFWTIFLSFLFFFILFFYITDFFYYDYLQQRLNASVLNYMKDAGISINMVWQTYPVLRSLLLIAILVILVGAIFSKLLRCFQDQASQKVKRSRLWIVPFTILLLAGTWGSLGQFALRWSDVFTLADAFKAQLALNPFQSFFSTLSFKNSGYDEKKTKAAYGLIAPYLGVVQRDSLQMNFERTIIPQGLIDSSAKPNIVLVICESFSAYKSSMWGNPLNSTPFFDSLSKAGIFFDKCFTPSFGTARGIWAIITGIPDVETPTTASRNPGIVDQRTIINAFKNYEKFYFIGGNASWANIRGLLKYNIEGLKLYEQEDYKAAKIDVWGISDENLFLEADKILAQQKNPFFAIIQTADNHRPYTIPAEDEKEFKKLQVDDDSLKKYGFNTNTPNDEFNAFRYTDFSYRKFIDAAKKNVYFKNTVFIFIGDHGIRGDAGNMFPKAWTQQALTTVHVPLLFYSPLLTASRHTNICSQLDVLPSIAGLLSVPFKNNTMGKNLFDTVLSKDNFRFSSAFTFDPDEKKIGIITSDYYFRKIIGKPGFELVSIKDNSPLSKGAVYDSVKLKLDKYASAFYETARFLLYNNKKEQHLEK